SERLSNRAVAGLQTNRTTKEILTCRRFHSPSGQRWRLERRRTRKCHLRGGWSDATHRANKMLHRAESLQASPTVRTVMSWPGVPEKRTAGTALPFRRQLQFAAL